MRREFARYFPFNDTIFNARSAKRKNGERGDVLVAFILFLFGLDLGRLDKVLFGLAYVVT